MKFSYVMAVLSLVAFSGITEAKTLDTLIIEGLSINQPSLVRNSIELKQGQEFTAADIQESIKKLYQLGIFKSIDCYADNETDSTISLILKLTEFSMCEAIEYAGQKKIKEKDFG
jgi:outer membrane protein insertion porin family